MKEIRIPADVFDEINEHFPKKCPICESYSVDVCYSDEDQNDPAVACMICGIIVMSASGTEEESIRLWNLLLRKGGAGGGV